MAIAPKIHVIERGTVEIGNKQITIITDKNEDQRGWNMEIAQNPKNVYSRKVRRKAPP